MSNMYFILPLLFTLYESVFFQLTHSLLAEVILVYAFVVIIEFDVCQALQYIV